MKSLIITLATIAGISTLLSTATSNPVNAKLKEADSLMLSHYKIEEAMEFNGHSYSDAIDLSDLESYYNAFKETPSDDNYDKFITEDAKVSKYEEELVANF